MRIVSISILFCCVIFNCKAAEQKEVTGNLGLSIERCLELALGSHYTIKLGELVAQGRKEDVFMAGETFQPYGNIKTSIESDEYETGSTFAGARVLQKDSYSLDLSVGKRWAYGTHTVLRWNKLKEDSNSSFLTINPAHTDRVAFEITQPLLQGSRKLIQRAMIDQALLLHKQANLDVILETEQLILQVYRQYLALHIAEKKFILSEEEVALSKQLLKREEEKLNLGRSSKHQVMFRKEKLNLDLESFEVATVNLRIQRDRLIYLVMPEFLKKMDQIHVYTVSTFENEGLTGETEFKAAYDHALDHRAEIKKRHLWIHSRQIDIELGKDKLRPDLNLFAAAGLKGLSDKAGDSTANAFSDGHENWLAGLELEFFFDRTSRLARYRKAMKGVGQAKLMVKALEDEIARELRIAIQQLIESKNRLDRAEKSMEFMIEEFQKEKALLDNGRSTELGLATRRMDVLKARLAVSEQQISRKIQILLFKAAKGSLFEIFEGVRKIESH